MKPKYPFTQSFDQLPQELPLYPLENALLPGGELPLELASPDDLALFLYALKTDQLIGMVQPQPGSSGHPVYPVGCAGRIRQYRERKDGRLNIMLTGLCRYRITDQSVHREGFIVARVDWSEFDNDYAAEVVESGIVDQFKRHLRAYFERHNMQVDWQVLDKLPVEQLVNNLVLVVNFDTDSKQRLLESPTLSERVRLLSNMLKEKDSPILADAAASPLVN